MEQWTLEFEWLRVRTMIKEKFKRDTLPDLNAVLFLIGIQELGQVKPSYTKEEKQDLMHIAVCRLASRKGYFELEGMDTEGWPHWKLLKPLPQMALDQQENFIKELIVDYFQSMDKETIP